MICHSFSDLFGALSYRSWIIAQQCGVAHTVNYWTELSGCAFLYLMYRRVLLVVLWFLIGTRLRLLAEELSTAEPLLPLSVSLLNDLSDPVFDGVGLAGFKSRANAFLLA